MSLRALLGTGGDGVLAHAAALDLVGRNISGAGTPGYARQRALLEANRVAGAGAGGVTFAGGARLVDRFAAARVIAESGLRGGAQGRADALAGLQAAVAPVSGGIGDAIGALFDAATALATDADDLTARRTFVARAEAVASGFRAAGDALATRRTEILQRADDVSAEVNARAAEIAELNTRISSADALGADASNLRDRRDVLLREIGERAPVQSYEEAGGEVSVMVGGALLVSGDRASRMSVGLDAAGGMTVTVTSPTGVAVDVTGRLDAGTIAGLREARDVDIAAAETALDDFARDFANAVNAVHASGVGLDGVGGRPLFAPPLPGPGAARSLVIDPTVAADPRVVAASDVAGALPGGNAIALALAGLRDASIGGATAAGRIAAMGGKLGLAIQAADQEIALRTDTLTMAENLDQQARGVSLEEEMVDLTRYQRAFEASMKVLRVADELLEGLIREM